MILLSAPFYLLFPEIPVFEELTGGISSLLALVLDTWKYGSQLKTCLQGDPYLVAMITSLQIYLRGADLCSLTQVCYFDCCAELCMTLLSI